MGCANAVGRTSSRMAPRMWCRSSEWPAWGSRCATVKNACTAKACWMCWICYISRRRRLIEDGLCPSLYRIPTRWEMFHFEWLCNCIITVQNDSKAKSYWICWICYISRRKRLIEDELCPNMSSFRRDRNILSAMITIQNNIHEDQ